MKPEPISPREYLRRRLNLRWQYRIDPGPADYLQVERDYSRFAN